jgi:hypothetical protein
MKTVPEVGDKWRTSSYSAQQTDCVELHPDGAVRDSKNPDGPVLATSLSGLLSAVKAGHLTR